MPTAASSTANGVAMPAPFPDALSPAINGIRNAMLKTGPMKPTDCEMTSTRVSFLPPLSRS